LAELSDFGSRVAQLLEPDARKRILAKAGAAGKKASLDAARADVGPDMAMSNLRKGKAKLSVGYDPRGSTSVVIEYRGPWPLADKGRKKSGPITPKKRGGKRAVMTPGGPRASSRYGPSRGLGTLLDAKKDAERDVPKAAGRQFAEEVRRVVR
jgi:hypothetical protein